MTPQENPPVLESNENLNVESPENLSEHSVAVDPKAMEDLEDLNAEIKFRQSETAEAIRDAQKNNGKGMETWDSKPETAYNIPPKQIPSNKFRNFMMATKIGLVGLLGLGATKEAKASDPTDSLKNKNRTEIKSNPTDSVETSKVFDTKKYEQFGISRADLLESNDPTKDILLVSIDEYKSYGDVFKVLKKAGLKPSSKETMDKMRDMNEDMFRRSGAVISLDETVNKLGNESYSTLTWDKMKNAFHGESLEIKGMKDNKKQEGSTFDSDYEVYRFIVEIPKSTTADYQSGIVKAK